MFRPQPRETRECGAVLGGLPTYTACRSMYVYDARATQVFGCTMGCLVAQVNDECEHQRDEKSDAKEDKAESLSAADIAGTG